MKSKIGIIVIFLAILLLEFAPATDANATTIGTSKTYTNLSDYTTYYILGNDSTYDSFSFGAGSQLGTAWMKQGEANTVDQYYVVAFEVSAQTQYTVDAESKLMHAYMMYPNGETGISITTSIIQFGYIHGTTLTSATTNFNKNTLNGGNGLVDYTSYASQTMNIQLYPSTSYEVVIDFHYYTSTNGNIVIDKAGTNLDSFIGPTSLSIYQS